MNLRDELLSKNKKSIVILVHAEHDLLTKIVKIDRNDYKLILSNLKNIEIYSTFYICDHN